MINIELIQAVQGDCIWIESLAPDERHFELLVITHIDADHIAGILKMFEEDELGVTFADIWFNGYQHLGKTGVRGVIQGGAANSLFDKTQYLLEQSI